MTIQANSLVLAVQDYLISLYPFYTRDDVRFMLIDLEQSHGQDAVTGLYGFIRYATITKQPPRRVMSVIGEVLNSRDDLQTTPRTASYHIYADL